jgi:adenylate kinase family enzyme
MGIRISAIQHSCCKEIGSAPNSPLNNGMQSGVDRHAVQKWHYCLASTSSGSAHSRCPSTPLMPNRWTAFPFVSMSLATRGAGKTTLAVELGGALGVPVHSLDSVVWQPSWKKTPAAERLVAEQELTAGPAWVIDRVSATVREASDLVLFLDVPRYLCAWRGLGRSLRYFSRTRPEMPVGCPEWRIVPRLLQIIHRFPSGAGITIRHEATNDPDRYRIIRDPREARARVGAFPDRCSGPSTIRFS